MDESGSKFTHKYCGTCGQTFELTVSFCPSDGTKLDEVSGNFVGELIKVRATSTQSMARPQGTDPSLPRPHITDPSLPRPHVTDPSIPRPQVTEPSLARPQTTPQQTSAAGQETMVNGNSFGTNQSSDITRQITLPKAPGKSDSASTVITASQSAGQSHEDASFEDLIGTTLDNQYELLEIIGKGGMSVVYKARHALLNRTVAIKTLRPHLMMHSQSLMRFQQEARAASNLRHKNVIYIHGFGEMGGKPYLVMDYVEGVALSDVIQKEGHLKPARAVNIFVQITDALEHAHAHGIIHRDLKPSNILLIEQKDADGSIEEFVYIVDFGIAKLLPQEGDEALSLTQTGEVFGSPLYMSPEQCRGEKIDHRADIYSLGCLMYETLTGRTPISGENTMDVLLRHTTEMPAAMSDKFVRVPASLEKIVLRCLVKDPNQRYQSMGKILSELNKFAADGVDGNFVTNVARKFEIVLLKRKARTARDYGIVALCVVSVLLVVGLIMMVKINDWNSINNKAAATELLFVGDRLTPPERKHQTAECVGTASFQNYQAEGVTDRMERHTIYIQKARAAQSIGCFASAGKLYQTAAELSSVLNGTYAVPTLMDWLRSAENYWRDHYSQEAVESYRRLVAGLDRAHDEFDAAHVDVEIGKIFYQSQKSSEALTFFERAYPQFVAFNAAKHKRFIYVPPKNNEELMQSEDFAFLQGHKAICRLRMARAAAAKGLPVNARELTTAARELGMAYQIFMDSKSDDRNQAAALANYLNTTPDTNDPRYSDYPHLLNIAKTAFGFDSPEYATIQVQYANYLWSKGSYWEAFIMHQNGSETFQTASRAQRS